MIPPVVSALLGFVSALFRSRAALHLEHLALRPQLAVYKQTVGRPPLHPTDRLFWAWLSRLWSGWESVLAFVQPRTVIAWQQQRVRDHWRRLSPHGTPGRPVVAPEVRELIQAVLFVRLILAHERRRVVYFHITEHPTAPWTAPQMVDAFPWDEAPRYRRRDRDRIDGASFRQRGRHMGSEDVLIAPRSPWQNPSVERLIGSLRRECLEHVIVLHKRHLRRLLTDSCHYDHHGRTHGALAMDGPVPRPVQRPELGLIREVPDVGGWPHHHERRAA